MKREKGEGNSTAGGGAPNLKLILPSRTVVLRYQATQRNKGTLRKKKRNQAHY